MSTGEWNHTICIDCWNKQNPGRSVNVALGMRREICCFCAADTYAGIYVRRDPMSAELACRPKAETTVTQ
jgi:hypothetical protein